ncbi:hypothetical protein ACLHIJ_01235 [Trueperella sp. LYQ141]
MRKICQKSVTWVVLVTVILEVVILAIRDAESWVGIWPRMAVICQIPLVYIGPIWAVFAAFYAVRTQENSFFAVSAALRPWRMHIVRIVRCFCYSVVPYLVGWMYILAVSWNRFGTGGIWWSYVLLALLELLGSVTIGYGCGIWIGGWFAQAIAFFLSYLWLTVSWDFSGAIVNQTYGYPDTDVNRYKIAALALFVAVVLLSACLTAYVKVLVACRWKSFSLLVVGASGCVLAIIAATFGVWLPGDYLTLRTDPQAMQCSHTHPQICVWQENSQKMPELLSYSAQLATLKQEFGFAIPDVISEQGLPTATGEALIFSIRGGTMWFTTHEWAFGIVDASFTNRCPASSEQAFAEQTQAYHELVSWMDFRMHGGQPSPVHGGHPDVDPQAMRRMSLAPLTEQHQWVSQHLAKLGDANGCQ